MSNDFGGPAFAQGAVRGIRVWQLRHMGRELRSVSQSSYVWRPGQNDASCALHVTELEVEVEFRESGEFQEIWVRDQPGRVFYRPLLERVVTRREPHTIAHPKCTCGFYAYWAGHHLEYLGIAGAPAVTGVIEAYGKVTLGPKGFRAEKAKIVALTCTYGPPPKPPTVFDVIGGWVALVAWSWWVTGMYFGQRASDDPHRTWWLLVSVGAALVGGFVGAMWLSRWLRRRRDGRPNILRAVQRNLSRAYPGVPIYSTMRAMLAKHPPDEAPEVVLAYGHQSCPPT